MANKKYIEDCGGLKPIILPEIKKGTSKKTAKKKVKRQPKK